MSQIALFTCDRCGEKETALIEDGVEQLGSMLCDNCIRKRKFLVKESLVGIEDEKPKSLIALYKPIGY